MNDPLATYLHDHLGGAKAAIDLLQAMRDRKKNDPLGEFAASLLVEVEADRETLQGLAEKIGSGANVFKELSGWFSEKVTRMKLGEGAAGSFGEFEALEFLALGLFGKKGMWQALEVAALQTNAFTGTTSSNRSPARKCNMTRWSAAGWNLPKACSGLCAEWICRMDP